jgi:hypothetical protein
MKLFWRETLDKGDVTIVLQVTPRPQPDLPNVPLAVSLAKTDEARSLIQAVHEPHAMRFLYALPPGTPKDRVQFLRKAFMDTTKDLEFLADAKKSNMDIDPVPGEEVEKIVDRLFKLEPALVGKLEEMLK